MLSVRCVPHLSDLVTVSSRNIQENYGVLSAVIATVPQFMSAYIADILVAVSAVSQLKFSKKLSTSARSIIINDLYL